MTPPAPDLSARQAPAPPPAAHAPPMTADMVSALLQALRQHEAALQHFPLRALLEGTQPPLALVMALLEQWLQRLGRDRAEIPSIDLPEIVAERQRVDAALDALAQLQDLTQQFAYTECGRLLRPARLPAGD